MCSASRQGDRVGVDGHRCSHAPRGCDHSFLLEELVKCVSLCVTLQGIMLRLLRHMQLVLGHLPGKREAGLVVFEGRAFLTAGRCFQASEAGKNQFTCENQPGGACWLLFGFLCLSKSALGSH